MAEEELRPIVAGGGTPSPGRAARPARRGLARYPRFLLVGLTGVVVNLATFVLTVDGITHRPASNFLGEVVHFASKTAPNPLVYLAASAVAFGVATLWNFALNSWWTFRSEQGHRHSAGRRLGLYYGVSLGSLAVNEVVLVATQAALPPLLGQGLGVVAGSIVGFLGNSRYTFAEASDLDREAKGPGVV
jgi:putative flippase GtrA